MNIFSKNFLEQQPSTATYQIGLMQAKAYRILKSCTAIALADFHITPLDWALIGLLYQYKSGLKFIAVAQALGVQAPLITRRAEELIKEKWVVCLSDETDGRVKQLQLTSYGRRRVLEIEPVLKKAMRPLLVNVSKKDLTGYFSVLTAIIIKGGKKT